MARRTTRDARQGSRAVGRGISLREVFLRPVFRRRGRRRGIGVAAVDSVTPKDNIMTKNENGKSKNWRKVATIYSKNGRFLRKKRNVKYLVHGGIAGRQKEKVTRKTPGEATKRGRMCKGLRTTFRPAYGVGRLTPKDVKSLTNTITGLRA